MVRKLEQHEISKALILAKEVFDEFESPDYSVAGIKTFHDFLKDKAQVDMLTIYGAFSENQLIGLLAMRGEGHMAMFFVKGKFHRQGIGRKLFEFALKNSNAEIITVNSSPYAVEVYHRFGFADNTPEQTKDGIRFTPMTYRR